MKANRQPEPSCAIIACDHGYGHVRRCLLLANRLAEADWQVHLLAPEMAVAKLACGFGLQQGVRVMDFHTDTTIDSLRQGNAGRWIDNLPSMDSFDLVISDNLPEILEARSDSVLCGSFLWHRALENVDASLFEYTEQLVKAQKPRMIASSLFASSYLYELAQLYPVGLCVAEQASSPHGKGNDLLLSCGMSGELEDEFRDLVDSLPSGQPPPFDTVWVEPRLMPESAPDWMKPAEYDSRMYRGLKAALCRPGVGTLTDCLWGGGRVFCYYEAGNREMIHNSSTVRNAGVGESCSAVFEAYRCACDYATARQALGAHLQALKKISFEGISETVATLEGFLVEGKHRIENRGV